MSPSDRYQAFSNFLAQGRDLAPVTSQMAGVTEDQALTLANMSPIERVNALARRRIVSDPTLDPEQRRALLEQHAPRPSDSTVETPGAISNALRATAVGPARFVRGAIGRDLSRMTGLENLAELPDYGMNFRYDPGIIERIASGTAEMGGFVASAYFVGAGLRALGVATRVAAGAGRAARAAGLGARGARVAQAAATEALTFPTVGALQAAPRTGDEQDMPVISTDRLHEMVTGIAFGGGGAIGSQVTGAIQNVAGRTAGEAAGLVPPFAMGYGAARIHGADHDDALVEGFTFSILHGLSSAHSEVRRQRADERLWQGVVDNARRDAQAAGADLQVTEDLLNASTSLLEHLRSDMRPDIRPLVDEFMRHTSGEGVRRIVEGAQGLPLQVGPSRRPPRALLPAEPEMRSPVAEQLDMFAREMDEPKSRMRNIATTILRDLRSDELESLQRDDLKELESLASADEASKWIERWRTDFNERWRQAAERGEVGPVTPSTLRFRIEHALPRETAETHQMLEDLINQRARAWGEMNDRPAAEFFENLAFDARPEMDSWAGLRFRNTRMTSRRKRGSFLIDPRRAVRQITLYRGANGTTLIHELMHDAIFDLRGQDRVMLESHYGVKNGEWSMAHHERAVDDMMRYLREGKIAVQTSSPVNNLIRKIGRYLRRMYAGLRRTGGVVPDEVAAVFDKIFFGGERARGEFPSLAEIAFDHSYPQATERNAGTWQDADTAGAWIHERLNRARRADPQNVAKRVEREYRRIEEESGLSREEINELYKHHRAQRTEIARSLREKRTARRAAERAGYERTKRESDALAQEERESTRLMNRIYRLADRFGIPRRVIKRMMRSAPDFVRERHRTAAWRKAQEQWGRDAEDFIGQNAKTQEQRDIVRDLIIGVPGARERIRALWPDNAVKPFAFADGTRVQTIDEFANRVQERFFDYLNRLIAIGKLQPKEAQEFARRYLPQISEGQALSVIGRMVREWRTGQLGSEVNRTRRRTRRETHLMPAAEVREKYPDIILDPAQLIRTGISQEARLIAVGNLAHIVSLDPNYSRPLSDFTGPDGRVDSDLMREMGYREIMTSVTSGDTPARMVSKQRNRLGELQGRAVRDDIADHFDTIMRDPGLVMRAYNAIFDLFRANKTYRNPATHVRNIVTKMLVHDLAGHPLLSPRTWTGIKTTWDLFLGRHTGPHREALADAMREYIEEFGAISDSGFLETARQRLATVDPPRGIRDWGRWAQEVDRIFFRMDAAAKAAYSISESLPKLQHYLELRVPAVFGRPNRPALTREEARNHTDERYENYTETPKVIDNLARIVPFIKFEWEIGRVMMNHVTRATRATLEMSRGGERRWEDLLPVIKVAFLAGALRGINEHARNALNLTDEDEDLIRSFKPSPFGILVPPEITGSNQPMYWDLTYVIPYADFARAEEGAPREDWMLRVVNRFTGNPIVLPFYETFVLNRSAFSNRDIARPTDPLSNRRLQILSYLYRTYAPAAVSSAWVNARRAMHGERDWQGLDRSLAREIARGYFGLSITREDPRGGLRRTALRQRGRRLDDMRSRMREIMRREDQGRYQLFGTPTVSQMREEIRALMRQPLSGR